MPPPVNDSANRMVQVLADTIGSRASLNFHTHISMENGLIFFSNPYASAAITKASLNMAVASLDNQPLTYENIGQIGSRRINPLLSAREIGESNFDAILEDPDYIKFAFVRNPVSRCLAGYSASLTKKTSYSEPRKKLFALIDLDLETDLSFEDFVELLALESEVRNLISLWMPQRSQIAFDIVEYDFIGRHEHWNTDFARISTEVFGDSIPVFDPRQHFNRDPDFTDINNDVSDKIKRQLEHIYESDFEMLNEIDENFHG